MVLNENDQREPRYRSLLTVHVLLIYLCDVHRNDILSGKCVLVKSNVWLSSRTKLSFSLSSLSFCSNVVFIINFLWYMKLLKISAIFGPSCLLADALLMLYICEQLYFDLSWKFKSCCDVSCGWDFILYIFSRYFWELWPVHGTKELNGTTRAKLFI